MRLLYQCMSGDYILEFQEFCNSVEDFKQIGKDDYMIDIDNSDCWIQVINFETEEYYELYN